MRKGSDILLPTTHVGAYPRPVFVKVVPPELVHVCADCAISSVRQVAAKRKLAAMVEGTRQVRADLEG